MALAASRSMGESLTRQATLVHTMSQSADTASQLSSSVARLANSASAMKGGSVAVMTALLACSVGEQTPFHWALFVLPGGLFMGFHAFFLQQERAFVQLYNAASDAPLAQVLAFRIDATRLASVREPLWKVMCRPTPKSSKAWPPSMKAPSPANPHR